MPKGKTLQERRRELGMSIYELARDSGIDHSLLYRYESGIYRPRLSNVERVARAYRMTVPEFLEALEASHREARNGRAS